MSKINNFKEGAKKYAAKKHIKSKFTNSVAHKNSEEDFLAGIALLLKLGYKSPLEVKRIESSAISYGVDWAQDKW